MYGIGSVFLPSKGKENECGDVNSSKITLWDVHRLPCHPLLLSSFRERSDYQTIRQSNTFILACSSKRFQRTADRANRTGETEDIVQIASEEPFDFRQWWMGIAADWTREVAHTKVSRSLPLHQV